jgi:hypothetical protein
MSLMRLCVLGSGDPEKKNDEPAVQPQQIAVRPVVRAPAEEPVKIATRPSVPFDQLRIRTAFSLQEAGGREPSGNGAATVEVVAEKTVQQFNRPFTLSDVQSCVVKFAESKLQAGSRQVGTIFRMAAVEVSEDVVWLTIQNEAQKEVLNEIRQEFVDQLRLQLQNTTVSLEIRLAETEIQTRAYKPHDIFREMSERNPALLELKKRFDLEIDY